MSVLECAVTRTKREGASPATTEGLKLYSKTIQSHRERITRRLRGDEEYLVKARLAFLHPTVTYATSKWCVEGVLVYAKRSTYRYVMVL